MSGKKIPIWVSDVETEPGYLAQNGVVLFLRGRLTLRRVLMSDASLRTRFSDDLKTSMKGGDKERVALLRMIGAKLKETDISARAKGTEQVGEDEIVSMLRGMAKSRAESAHLYREGGRPELAEKEEAEIEIIKSYLPAEMDDAALETAIEAIISETGAASVKDMGKVMGALKSKFGAALDLGRANTFVKKRLAG